MCPPACDLDAGVEGVDSADHNGCLNSYREFQHQGFQSNVINRKLSPFLEQYSKIAANRARSVFISPIVKSGSVNLLALSIPRFTASGDYCHHALNWFYSMENHSQAYPLELHALQFFRQEWGPIGSSRTTEKASRLLSLWRWRGCIGAFGFAVAEQDLPNSNISAHFDCRCVAKHILDDCQPHYKFFTLHWACFSISSLTEIEGM